ncbi:MAG: hypothetical protein AAGI01_00055 [Myxococcota bacterium]
MRIRQAIQNEEARLSGWSFAKLRVVGLALAALATVALSFPSAAFAQSGANQCNVANGDLSQDLFIYHNELFFLGNGTPGPQEQIGLYALEGIPDFMVIFSDGTVRLLANGFEGEMFNDGLAFGLSIPNSTLTVSYFYEGCGRWQSVLCTGSLCRNGPLRRLRNFLSEPIGT